MQLCTKAEFSGILKELLDGRWLKAVVSKIFHYKVA
jgi:hypothetical protein